MIDDAELLRQFVHSHSERAFRELVGARIGLVYTAALRQVGGDVHLAQDVTQSVFIDFARQARKLVGRTNLSGWLYTSTRFAAAKALRSRTRRMSYETAAQAMSETLAARIDSAASDADWRELRPVLDAAMHELGERDREAILLRFFDGRSLADVGAAIGLAENSARMRIERALEKLRERLARRGITSTAAALGAALARQPAIAVPSGFAASVAGGALVGAAATSGVFAIASLTFPFMGATKVTFGIAGAIAAVGLGALLGVSYQSGRGARPAESVATGEASTLAWLREENNRLKVELARATEAARTATPGNVSRVEQESVSRASATLANLRVLIDLQRRKLATPEMDFIRENDGTLSPAFVELFGLTAAEQDSLQRAVNATRQRLAGLERENATVARTPNGGVMIAIKAFPEAGGAAYDAMLQAFAGTLGTERHHAFLALAADKAERELKRFGTPKRTLTISRVVGADGASAYSFQEDSHLPHENGRYSSDFRTFDELTRAMGDLSALLPPDFAPRK